MSKEIFQSGEMYLLYPQKWWKCLLKNHRPISLTNTDYKTNALIFAHRLQKVIDKYISKEQTVYIKGTCIGTNERLILYIFEYCEKIIKKVYSSFEILKKLSILLNEFSLLNIRDFNFENNFIHCIKISFKTPIFFLK